MDDRDATGATASAVCHGAPCARLVVPVTRWAVEKVMTVGDEDVVVIELTDGFPPHRAYGVSSLGAGEARTASAQRMAVFVPVVMAAVAWLWPPSLP